MFTRSTLPTLATVVLLAWGSCAGAEAFDPHAVQSGWMVRQTKPLSSSYTLRGDTLSLRSVGRDAIEPWRPAPSASAAEPLASWPDSAANTSSRASRLSFERTPDDVRAGTSSALISLGRLNLNEPRSAALGSVSQAELDRELAQLRDSLGRVRPVPQVSLGMRVKF
jgi:hypothetical protein